MNRLRIIAVYIAWEAKIADLIKKLTAKLCHKVLANIEFMTMGKTIHRNEVISYRFVLLFIVSQFSFCRYHCPFYH